MVNLENVAVDVFPFVQACGKANRIVMTGIYRHAELLGKRYKPVVYLEKNEQNPHTPEFTNGLTLVTKHLKRGVYVAREGDAVFPFDFFLSLGVDQTGPVPLEPKYTATILHDTLSAEGHFGEMSLERYKVGANRNQTFLYVSESSLADFNLYCIQNAIDIGKKVFIAYGCPHRFTRSALKTDEAHQQYGLTVHTLQHRKNFELEHRLIAQYFKLEHVHIGEESDDFFHRSIPETFPFKRLMGGVDDNVLDYVYRHAGVFVSLSKREGFNMPPMEAIILGVPEVILSDIPVHREIYGECNVNLLPLDLTTPYLSKWSKDPGSLRKIMPQDRNRLFEKFAFDNLIKPFEDYLESL